MAGSSSPLIFRTLGLARGQSEQLLNLESASQIVNLTANPSGGLSTSDGFCPLEPARGQPVLSGNPHGVFQARLNSVYTMTLARVGSVLYEHRGFNRAYAPLVTGLVDSINTEWPDQFAQINGTIVWCNGTDRARQISMDGLVTPLGFGEILPAPGVDGPASPDESERQYYYPNSMGLSWPGNIGTAGEVLYANHGKLLASRHRYAQQPEDAFGNLGPLSRPSATLEMDERTVKPIDFISSGATDSGSDGNEISDTFKMFAVQLPPSGIESHVRTHVLRTKNIRYAGPEFYRAFSNGVVSAHLIGDRTNDGALGEAVESYELCPSFRVLGAHGDRLVVANTTSQSGLVMVSEPGFPGTFKSSQKYGFPEEVTGIKSHGGILFIFTTAGLYALDPEVRKINPIQGSCGCVAPKSIAVMPDGAIIWLGNDQVYYFAGEVARGIGTPINTLLRFKVNKSRLKKAVAWIDPDSGGYMLALPRSGQLRNTLVLSYVPEIGWSEFDYHLEISDVAVAVAPQDHVYCAANEIGEAGNVYILNRRVPTYTPPNRRAVYRTRWIRRDPTMMESFSLRNFHVTFIETGNYEVTIRVYRDQIDYPVLTRSMYMYDLPISSLRNGVYFNDTVTLGDSPLREPRMTTRWLALNSILDEGSADVRCCSIEITCEFPARMHLIGLSYNETPPQTIKEFEGRLVESSVAS